MLIPIIIGLYCENSERAIFPTTAIAATEEIIQIVKIVILRDFFISFCSFVPTLVLSIDFFLIVRNSKLYHNHIQRQRNTRPLPYSFSPNYKPDYNTGIPSRSTPFCIKTDKPDKPGQIYFPPSINPPPLSVNPLFCL